MLYYQTDKKLHHFDGGFAFNGSWPAIILTALLSGTEWMDQSSFEVLTVKQQSGPFTADVIQGTKGSFQSTVPLAVTSLGYNDRNLEITMIITAVDISVLQLADGALEEKNTINLVVLLCCP